MKFNKAAEVIAALPAKQSILLLGQPGIGKTSLGRFVGTQMCPPGGLLFMDDEGDEADEALDERDKQVAAVRPKIHADMLAKLEKPLKTPKEKRVFEKAVSAEAHRQFPLITVVEVRDLCSHLPEDLLGLPFRIPEKNVTRYCAPEWLARLSRPGVQGVLILDDLAGAAAAVQTAAFKLTLERRSGSCTLQPTVKLIATANRREDKSGATMLAAALRNRMYIETIHISTEDWCQWAFQNKLHGDVMAFLRWKPSDLSKSPKEADENGAFATPRTWHMLAEALPAAKATDTVIDVASGLVGSGIAAHFAGFCALRDEVADPRALLENPEQAMPVIPDGKDPSKIIAICTAIAECAAPLSMDKRYAADMPYKFMHALCHVSNNGREFAASGILTYAAAGANVQSLIKCARDGRADPRFKQLLQHLKSGLLPAGVAGGPSS